MKPVIAMVLGDPAGVGPEVVAKVLSVNEFADRANVLLIADEDELRRGMDIALCPFNYQIVSSFEEADFTSGTPVLLEFKSSCQEPLVYGKETVAGGTYIIESLKIAVDLTLAGKTHGICFAPLNKKAMNMAGLGHRDELSWFAELTGYKGFGCEVNVVDNIWAGRVTSHIPFRDVVDRLSIDSVLETIELMQRTLVSAGIEAPKIAVQALNPHGGEGGLFGDEEITIISPSIEKAKEKGIDAYGPFPADTTMWAVQQQELNAVVSMYHDQGATALKMMGFDRGVTVQGGIPIPIATANHGSAYDIYGKNLATPLAFKNALDLTIQMANVYQNKFVS
ncbi:4-hydroxythreonine-4-phosphate dehydrogenase PdxA [Photobacterium sp. ZSDE20]|uniref:4-hydroxythreonine-4-phosphate dehydrogenase PdxA n=1 Tax=Photobacterium pectinilyticum TaxID=2906793 RepID=A0ABT1N7X5_9GAMM|nr:4-hydroxythreonine-4-phosphate dehydrogenase PdxA [Photobacterium sp. ZSDE20]MCQ1060838.1 4-hydroxythreonine-4-phosphate dehydrogenase PdxA [Photobacterium sp. ZSDE20]MDD1828649.1 4-hydroxythreonine-4-phosphate dehydrogenase PdxA [Photobacterium sp. ZSDE20]